MKKIDVLKLIAKHKVYAKKKMLLSLFAIVTPDEIGKTEPYIGQICSEDDKIVILDEELQPVVIEGWKADAPYFEVDEVVELEAGDLINLSSKVKTTYGVVLINLFISHAFENKIEFINGEIDYGILESAVLSGHSKGEITVEQLRTFLKTISWATGIMPLFVVPTSPRSIQGSPEAKSLRKKLIEERKDRLDDPTALAEIDTALAKLDKEYIEGDITETFYKSGKAFNVTRKRMYSIFGGEADIEDPSKMSLVTNSLEEEWDVEQMPAMINSSRMGSYKRGAETALGGADFKDLSRMFQNIRVTEKDCGSKIGKPTLVTNENYRSLVGRYDMKGNVMTTDITKANIGKRITLRTPQACKASGSNFCPVCVGDAVASNPNSVGMLAANLGASFLGIMMAAMHGRALKLVEVDLPEVLS